MFRIPPVKLQATFTRWIIRIAVLLVLAVVAVQLWYAGWIAWWRWNDPDGTAFMRRELAALQARNSRAELKHRWVPYERIATSLKRAVITAEDARFAEHEGVDWEAIEKAYKDNVKRGRPARGGSTITQQLAKNLFLSPERSYWRKAEEAVVTVLLEALLPKQRIFELYLNVIEWGNGVFGAEAAAQRYFGVSAAQLSAAQAARLAAMTPSPRVFERRPDSAYLDGRVATILARMPSASVP